MQEQIFNRKFDKFTNKTTISGGSCWTWRNPFISDMENDRRPVLVLSLHYIKTPDACALGIAALSTDHNFERKIVNQLIIRINDCDNIILNDSTVTMTITEGIGTIFEISTELLEKICNANSLEFQTTIENSGTAEYRCFPNSEESKWIFRSSVTHEYDSNFQLYAQTFYNEVFDSNAYVKEHLHALQEIEAQKNREETKYQENRENERTRKFLKVVLTFLGIYLILIAIVCFYFLVLA